MNTALRNLGTGVMDSPAARRLAKSAGTGALSPLSDLARVAYYEMLRGFRDQPLYLSAETTVKCNNSCGYCPITEVQKSRPNVMEMSVFERIVNEMAAAFPGYTGRVMLHNYGEPLMDRRLPDLIRIAKKALPDASYTLFSNGELMTQEKYLALKASGIEKFCVTQHNGHIPRGMQSWYDPANPPEDMRYQVLTAEFGILNRGGTVHDAHVNKGVNFCYFAPFGLTFTTSGDAVMCCNDPLATNVLGNIENGLAHIWHDRRYTFFRRLVEFGIYTHPTCKDCRKGSKS